ncbi:MAG: hypothetical protein ACOCTM_03865 [Bacteroidota bacterium]
MILLHRKAFELTFFDEIQYAADEKCLYLYEYKTLSLFTVWKELGYKKFRRFGVRHSPDARRSGFFLSRPTGQIMLGIPSDRAAQAWIFSDFIIVVPLAAVVLWR